MYKAVILLRKQLGRRGGCRKFARLTRVSIRKAFSLKVRIPAAAYRWEKKLFSHHFGEVSSSQFWELEDAR